MQEDHYIHVKQERVYNPSKGEEDTYIRINAQGAGALAVILAFIVSLFTIAAIVGGVTSGCALPDDDEGERLPPPKPGKDCSGECDPGGDPERCKTCQQGPEGAYVNGTGGHTGEGGGSSDPCFAECFGPYASETACETCNIGGN